MKQVLGDSTKKDSILKKAVLPRKRYTEKRESGSSSGRRRSRSRSSSPRRSKNDNKSKGSGSSSKGSSNYSRKRNSGGGGKSTGDYGSKAKKSKSDSSKKKGNFDSSISTLPSIIDSCISTWPSFLTAKAIMMVTTLGLIMNKIPSLDNIPIGGRISQFLNNWRIVCKNEWVLRVVEYGYRIPVKTVPWQRKCPRNPPATGSAYDVLVNEASQLKIKQAVKAVLSVPGQFVSGYFAVPKPRKIDQFRPILNLKYFNEFVRKYKFRMETLSNVREWIKPNAYCIGLDLRDAFLHIPINRQSRKYLRFKWLDELLEWQVLPFGLTCSPRVITKVL